MLFDLARTHSRVAVDLFVGTKTHLLPGSGASHAIPNRCGTFCARAGDIAIFHGRNFDVQIDAIQKWPRKFVAGTLHLERIDATVTSRVTEASAICEISPRGFSCCRQALPR
jgi:hypothetical protein